MTDSAGNEQLANLIIAGVNKAGSTSLFHYLTSHPSVCGSRDKETCYFLPLLYNEPIQGIGEYQLQFNHCSEAPYRLDATPGYVYGGETIAGEIKSKLKDVKIIIILKNPVDRLVSFFQRKKSTFQVPGDVDFKTYVKCCFEKSPADLKLKKNFIYTGVHYGLYHQYLESWLETFGNNLKIVFFDDLKKNPRSFMRSICEWLDIDGSYYDEFAFDVKNKSMQYRNRYVQRLAVMANNVGQRFWRSNPDLKQKILGLYYNFNGTPYKAADIDSQTLGFLHQYYKPHNEQLQKLLMDYHITNLPPWLEPVKIPA